MSARAGLRALAAIFAVALVVRIVTASQLHNPGYLDGFGYFHDAENLAKGRGLVEDFTFAYIDPSAVARALPHPSHLYWMPLTSLLAGLGIAAFGGLVSPFAAAQAPFVMLSALLPPLAAALAFRLHGSRAFALYAAALALFAPSYFDRFCVTEPVTPFALAAMVTLLLVAAPQPRAVTLIAAGVAAGLAHLTRADGVLLVPVAIYVLATTRAAEGEARGRARLRAARNAAVFAAAYLAVMAPWWLRQAHVAGTPFPGGGAKTAFFLGYDDMFAFDGEVTAARFVASGFAAMARSRLDALVANAMELTSIFQVVLLPMAVYAFTRLDADQRTRLRAVAIYAVALVAFMTLVTPHPAHFGSLYRSSSALVPFVAALAPAGAAAAIKAYARWRGHDPEAAARVFGGAFALSFVGLAAVYHAREVGSLASDAEPWNTRLDAYSAIGKYLDAQPGEGARTGAVVLTTNPPAFTLATGRPSAMTPTDGAAATRHAADFYAAPYLVLESNLAWALPVWQSGGALPGYRFVRDFPDGRGAPARLYARDAR